MKIKHDCSSSQGCSWFQWAEPGFLQGMVAPLPRSLPSPCLQVGPKNSVLLPVHSPRGAGAASASSRCCCISAAPGSPEGCRAWAPHPGLGIARGDAGSTQCENGDVGRSQTLPQELFSHHYAPTLGNFGFLLPARHPPQPLTWLGGGEPCPHPVPSPALCQHLWGAVRDEMKVRRSSPLLCELFIGLPWLPGAQHPAPGPAHLAPLWGTGRKPTVPRCPPLSPGTWGLAGRAGDPRHYLEVGVPWPSCSRELVA